MQVLKIQKGLQRTLIFSTGVTKDCYRHSTAMNTSDFTIENQVKQFVIYASRWLGTHVFPHSVWVQVSLYKHRTLQIKLCNACLQPEPQKFFQSRTSCLRCCSCVLTVNISQLFKVKNIPFSLSTHTLDSQKCTSRMARAVVCGDHEVGNANHLFLLKNKIYIKFNDTSWIWSI